MNFPVQASDSNGVSSEAYRGSARKVWKNIDGQVNWCTVHGRDLMPVAELYGNAAKLILAVRYALVSRGAQ